MDSGALGPDTDDVRAGWRRWRAGPDLTDTESESFGDGGLARLIPDRTPRFLIVPSDPGAHLAEFDADFWEWWGSESSDPSTGGPTSWGPHKVPTADAAVFGTDYGESGWSRYLALYRNGALEAGLGEHGSREVREQQRIFWLSRIVGRCWAAATRYVDVVQRFELEPPFEVCLVLRETRGAALGGFAEGWAEPGSFEHIAEPCAVPNLLIRREYLDWPASPDALQAMAFSLGAQVEDAWGVTQRRFLAHRGDYEGNFDPRAASWR